MENNNTASFNRKYLYGTDENKSFLAKLRKELLNFGVKFPSPDGSSYYLGDDGTPWTDRNRETWITSRMTHVYSIGSILLHSADISDSASTDFSAESANTASTAFSAEAADTASTDDVQDKYKLLASEGLKGLCGRLHDSTHGGWYAGITPAGDNLPNKQCYAHAFVILAASSAMLAGVEGAKKLLDDALDIYDKYFWDDRLGLACDTWNTEFDKCDSYRGLNANMHTVEAFLAVYDATGNEEYRERAGRIIGHVIEWAKSNDYRIPEHFTEEWKPDLECNYDRKDDPFKPYGATPGHGIEWARLIAQWASGTAKALHKDKNNSPESEIKDSTAISQTKIKGNAASLETVFEAKKYYEISEMLYNRAIGDAWNSDGAPGIVYTTDWNGNPVVHDRMHWTLAEAINTSSVLFRITGKQKYADDYAEFLKYLDETVHDKVNGSWFHQLDRENHLLGTVWPGKSDLYHAFQATLIPYSDVSISIAAAISVL